MRLAVWAGGLAVAVAPERVSARIDGFGGGPVTERPGG